jgi:hypothetical protein
MERERNPDLWFRFDYPVLLAVGKWDQGAPPGS